MTAVTVVSDPGIDDLVALALLLKLLPTANNALISTFGNAAERITARNAKEFIAFAAPHWQFFNGAQLPLNGTIEKPWPDYFHGPDGVWGVHPMCDVHGVRSVDRYPANTRVISLSPMRDALSLLREGNGKQYSVMGGAFHIEGNETKYAETNIAFDPDSAAEFFASCEGVDVQVVPLDVTRKVFWDRAMIEHIPETSENNRWLKKLLHAWFDKYNHEREKNFNLHDPLAVYLFLNREEAVWKESGVAVVTEGEQRGRTIFSDSHPTCKVALDLKNPEKIAREIYKTLFH